MEFSECVIYVVGVIKFCGNKLFADYTWLLFTMQRFFEWGGAISKFGFFEYSLQLSTSKRFA
jgi:hypothetical protein